MQNVSDAYLEALTGSFVPVVQVDAWYDGDLVLSGVPVETGSVTLDNDRVISGALHLTAASGDDSLAPDRWEAPLAPYGSELHVRCGLRTGAGVTELITLGWFRIDVSDPQEWWKPYYDTPSSEPRWAYLGTKVDVEASDRMAAIEDARFLVPEAPESLSSVLGEIVRLARGIVPIGDLSGISDTEIPASVAYQTSRTQAIQDLAGVLDRKARINANGALVLVPRTATGDPVWTIRVGRDGEVVDWNRKLDRRGLYNAVISSGTTAEGAPVQWPEQEASGPLRYGGPFGRVPYGHTSPLITSETAAQTDAATRLANLIRDRVVPIRVSCIANPALELDDLVEVVLPDKTLIGPVTAISWPIPATTMEFTVEVPRADIWG